MARARKKHTQHSIMFYPNWLFGGDNPNPKNRKGKKMKKGKAKKKNYTLGFW